MKARDDSGMMQSFLKISSGGTNFNFNRLVKKAFSFPLKDSIGLLVVGKPGGV